MRLEHELFQGLRTESMPQRFAIITHLARLARRWFMSLSHVASLTSFVRIKNLSSLARSASLGSLARLRVFLLVALAGLLAACASPGVERYADQQPPLDLSRYFTGTLDGYGMVRNRSGEVIRRFHVVIETSWDGDTGVLDEKFVWSDGVEEQRIWTLRRQADGTWRGTAGDVVGEAIGVVAGNALNWRYVLRLPVGERVFNVDFDDWMYLVTDDVMLNHAVMSKFGIRLADIFISFKRRPAEGAAPAAQSITPPVQSTPLAAQSTPLAVQPTTPGTQLPASVAQSLASVAQTMASVGPSTIPAEQPSAPATQTAGAGWSVLELN